MILQYIYIFMYIYWSDAIANEKIIIILLYNMGVYIFIVNMLIYINICVFFN